MKTKTNNTIISLIAANTNALVFLISSVGMVGSLFFQYALHLSPCEMCWYQRIALYPIVFISGVALFTDDNKVWKYILPISVVGLALAVYHNVLQALPLYIPCTSGSTECAQKQIEVMGFDAIPVLSAVAFLTIILLMILQWKKS